MKLYRLASLALLSTALVACNEDDDTGTGPQPTALLRVVNASSSTSTADLYVGNQSAALGSGIGAGAAGPSCFAVPAGTQTLSFRQGGAATSVAGTAPFDFISGQRYTVLLTGSGTATGTRTAVLLTDNTVTAPPTGQNAIRFFNATGVSGDVYVTAPGASPGTASQTGLASNTATTGGSGGYTNYPTGSTLVRVFPTGGATTGNPIVTFTIPTLPGNRIATVVLTGGAAGAQAFVATPCD